MPLYVKYKQETVKNDKPPSLGSLYVPVQGKEFDTWVDAGSRDNGYDSGDLIENPAYVIEDFLRSQIFAEFDVEITANGTWDSGTKTTITCPDLLSSVDDYYNGAYVVHVRPATGTATQLTVSDYVGSTNVLSLSAAVTVANGDYVYLWNIQGDNRINIASFDAVGNATDGHRDDGGGTGVTWEFARSVNAKLSSRMLLDQLLYESHCMLVLNTDPDTGVGQYELYALEAGSSDGTLSTPLHRDGLPQIAVSLTDLAEVYTDFTFRYLYHYGKGSCVKTLFCNKNDSSTGIGSTYETYCQNAIDNYKVNRKFHYECSWIRDDDTAEELFKLLIKMMTKQRLLIQYEGNIKDYIDYKVGNVVLVNYADMIPTGVNNSTKFRITQKTVVPKKKDGSVLFQLTEIVE